MTDTLDLQSLRQAAEAATAGPWKFYKARLRPQFPVMVHEIQKEGEGPIVSWGGFDGLNKSKSQITADARYIAIANPATILALLDERDALLDRLERETAAKASFERMFVAACDRMAAAGAAVPEVLFDGYAVYAELNKGEQARTSYENVSDVLDAVVRIFRRAAPAAPSAPTEQPTLDGVKLDVIARSYGFALSVDGELHGLTAGDMGYEQTGIKLEGKDLAIWKAAAEPAPVAQASQQPVGARQCEACDGKGVINQCVICGASEPRTGTCGSSDPRALCNFLAAPLRQAEGAQIIATGYESGFMATDPNAEGATINLHYKDEATAEAAFCALSNMIDRAIAASANQEDAE